MLALRLPVPAPVPGVCVRVSRACACACGFGPGLGLAGVDLCIHGCGGEGGTPHRAAAPPPRGYAVQGGISRSVPQTAVLGTRDSVAAAAELSQKLSSVGFHLEPGSAPVRSFPTFRIGLRSTALCSASCGDLAG